LFLSFGLHGIYTHVEGVDLMIHKIPIQQELEGSFSSQPIDKTLNIQKKKKKKEKKKKTD
jgi:hypothetical protein